MLEEINFDVQESKTESNTDKIIENRSVLDISYIPESIKHRNEQIQEMLDKTFSDVINGDKGSDGFALGPPGTGKTATVKFLRRKLDENNDSSKYRIIYINCSNHSSGQAVFRELCNRVGAEFQVGVELAENINNFKRTIKDDDDRSVLIILDEIQCLVSERRDYLSRPILYELSRPSEGILNSDWDGSITVLGISNSRDVMKYVDDDVKSSLEGPKIYDFPRYTEHEIVDILEERQEQAFKYNVVTKTALRKIAREVSNNFHGDIRKGIEILKKMPKQDDDLAELKNRDQEQIRLVEVIIRELQKDRLREVLFSEDDDFYIVMAALYQQIMEEKPRLKYITQSYSNACELAEREKKGGGFDSRKTYVYRQLEKLVDAQLLSKKKDHSTQNKPNYYEANFDVELFRELIDDRLQRCKLYHDLHQGNYSVSGNSTKEQELLDNLQSMATDSEC